MINKAPRSCYMNNNSPALFYGASRAAASATNPRQIFERGQGVPAIIPTPKRKTISAAGTDPDADDQQGAAATAAERTQILTPLEVKQAYRAARNLDRERQRLQDLEKRAKQTEELSNIYTYYREWQLPADREEVRRQAERVRECQATIDNVMNWAEQQPPKIRSIVTARVLYGQSWGEISAALFNSETMNTSYMALKRAMEADLAQK